MEISRRTTPMDSIFITAALNSTFQVFETMAQFRPKPGIPALKTDQYPLGAVTGIMRMQGDRANGRLAISFSKTAIFDIAHRMLGENHEKINEHICDLTGELVNMIVGGAKKTLAEEGYDFDMSTPDIFTSHSTPISNDFSGETVSVPFETPAGKFYLELTYATSLEEQTAVPKAC